MTSITNQIKKKALSLGFFRVGAAPAESLDPAGLDSWLDHGYHGTMAFMKNHRDLRLDPRLLLPNAKSVVVAAMNYYKPVTLSPHPRKGRISRYALGDDYHDVLRKRLKQLLVYIQEMLPGTRGRVCVDSAPILEKTWAVRAGIGQQGKHSNVLTRDYGSWFFLGEIIVDYQLDYDSPIDKDFCGTCTRCMDACPTGAIVEPYVVDSRRCISYLTIELKAENPLPPNMRKLMGNWIFGCDVCQQVCPWNQRFAQASDESAFSPRSHTLAPDLQDLASMDKDEFDGKYRQSPIKRAKYEGLKRNIQNALSNAESHEE